MKNQLREFDAILSDYVILDNTITLQQKESNAIDEQFITDWLHDK